MKKTLLIALLGATVSLTVPSLSFADNGYKFQSEVLERNHRYKHKHNHRHHHNQKPVIKDRSHNQQHIYVYNKHGYDRHGYNRHGYNKHGYNKHGYNKNGYNKHKQHYSHNNEYNNKPAFSISWNVGNSGVTYGNNSHSYNHTYYNNGRIANTNKHYQKNRGRKIYKRLNRQANRIQNGINNGQLVHREVRKLRREQRDIKQTLSHYKRDGHLNKYERSKLMKLLDIASNNIHRKSNNHKTRYSQQHNNGHTYYVQF